MRIIELLNEYQESLRFNGMSEDAIKLALIAFETGYYFGKSDCDNVGELSDVFGNGIVH